MKKRCNELEHISSGGTVVVCMDKIQVYDICKKCNNHYIRKPTKEEFENYKSLLNKSN
jgi:hypothetical protein